MELAIRHGNDGDVVTPDKAFETADADEDGHLTLEELQNWIEMMGIETGSKAKLRILLNSNSSRRGLPTVVGKIWILLDMAVFLKK